MISLRFSNHVDYHTKLEDQGCFLDLSFLTGKLNEWNIVLQRKSEHVVNMMSSVSTFQSELQLMPSRLLASRSIALRCRYDTA